MTIATSSVKLRKCLLGFVRNPRKANRRILWVYTLESSGYLRKEILWRQGVFSPGWGMGMFIGTHTRGRPRLSDHLMLEAYCGFSVLEQSSGKSQSALAMGNGVPALSLVVTAHRRHCSLRRVATHCVGSLGRNLAAVAGGNWCYWIGPNFLVESDMLLLTTAVSARNWSVSCSNQKLKWRAKLRKTTLQATAQGMDCRQSPLSK